MIALPSSFASSFSSFSVPPLSSLLPPLLVMISFRKQMKYTKYRRSSSWIARQCERAGWEALYLGAMNLNVVYFLMRFGVVGVVVSWINRWYVIYRSSLIWEYRGTYREHVLVIFVKKGALVHLPFYDDWLCRDFLGIWEIHNVGRTLAGQKCNTARTSWLLWWRFPDRHLKRKFELKFVNIDVLRDFMKLIREICVLKRNDQNVVIDHSVQFFNYFN